MAACREWFSCEIVGSFGWILKEIFGVFWSSSSWSFAIFKCHIYFKDIKTCKIMFLRLKLLCKESIVGLFRLRYNILKVKLEGN